ncbi:MFS transporter [Dyella telluris]|uniref:MFS transporter n=1 Tax=Dyella telluris TaxID=2763498 RepID=A0A7G8Q2Z1_9GAMM|nr:MFS transporter [Dyella telluris]QNK01149.1 MFS transporter [Dyella telluris]
MASKGIQRGHGRRAALTVATGLAVMFVAATLLTPLYPLYRRSFGFGEITLTLVYSSYVLGNIGALFFFARLSDQAGRRFMVWPAIGVALASTAAFGLASGVAWLFVGRALSGFATGLASSTMAAWITELQPEGANAGAVTASAANFVGLAAGPWLSALAAQFNVHPLRLPFAVYAALLVLTGIVLVRVPETVPHPQRRPAEWSLRPRLGIPRDILASFISPAVTAFLTFALFGFYAALIPGMLAEALKESRPVVSAAVVFGLFAVAAAMVVIARRLPSRTAMLGGLSLFPPAVALLVMAEHLQSMPLLLAASVLAGAAGALGYRGSLAVVNRIAPAERRGEVVATYLIMMFCGNSLPVIGIGLVSATTGALTAHVLFAGLIAVLAISGLVIGWRYAPNDDAPHEHST